MNVVKLICLFLCCMYRNEVTASSQVYIKLSVYDCVNCNANLHGLMQKEPSIKLVLNAEFVRDSVDIMDRFNLTSYRGRITWNSELYQRLSHNNFSEVVQVCNDSIVQYEILKGLDHFDVLPCAGGSCRYKLPQTINIRDNKSYVFVSNYITENKFFYAKQRDQLSAITIDSPFACSYLYRSVASGILL